MPAPTFYNHWCSDKPVTTNEVYGFFHRRKLLRERKEREKLEADKANQRPATADPSQSSLPVINKSSKLPSIKSAPSRKFEVCASDNYHKRNVVPWVPKNSSQYFTNGMRSTNHFTAQPLDSNTDFPNKGKPLYLWHTLTGCTVRVVL